MIYLTNNFKGKTVTVAGIGVSNKPLIDYLLEHGAIITARDMKPRDTLGNIAAELESKGIHLVCGENYLDDITDEYIFRSPGIKFDKPGLIKAVANGSVLTSEMELFFDLCPAKLIGITGSNGKTTTTTLISKFIEAQYGHVYVGGNIGTPLLPLVHEMTADDYAVVELSSFQLQTMTKSPDIAVVTNLSPNHLDYHNDMEEYADAKKNIFRYQKPKDRLILNNNCDITRKFADEIQPDVELIMFNDTNGFYDADGKMYYRDKFIMNTMDIFVPGHHNIENFMSAIAATYGFIDLDIIQNIAKTFKGVEHRIEFVRELNDVKYYNNSADSSPSRCAAALDAFNQKVIIICGGYDKQIPFDSLAKPLCDKAKIIVLTGATAPKIKAALLESGENLPPVIEAPDFNDAVMKAHENAQNGDVVLLSPACASFDAFKNFAERGQRFKDIVNNL